MNYQTLNSFQQLNGCCQSLVASRRYASVVFAMTLCLSQVGVLWNQLDTSGWLSAQCLPFTYCTLYCTRFHCLQNQGASLWNVVLHSGLSSFLYLFTADVVRCKCCLLSSTDDRRPLITLSVHLCSQHHVCDAQMGNTDCRSVDKRQLRLVWRRWVTLCWLGV